jgi:aspartyl-tRNA(Asn)/glutamyl-tRNA(Gln) amidotransferase subunit A
MTVVDDAILELSAEALAGAVRRGDLSALEVIGTFLARIEDRAAGNAFISTCPKRAFRRAARGPTGPLAGVPLAVKDLFETAGVRTTYGSAIFRDHLSTRTAPAVRALEAAGAIVVGKTNLDEFAWGVTSQNPHWGTVANPVRPGRVAGGSSGGTAAALADRLCTIGLGTDTGGSIRIPAACCQVVGFKPRFGAVSTDGIFPLAPSFDTVGPMARTVRDVALVHAVLTGQKMARAAITGVRVGVLEWTGVEDELVSLGARVAPAVLPEPTADLLAVFRAECAITHMASYPSRQEEYGPDVRRKLESAQMVSVVDYRRGLLALGDLRERARTDPAVDVVISPTLAIEPPPDDCRELDVRAGLTAFTRRFNYLGWPAIAIGNLQVAGREDRTVLGVAMALEASRVGLG